MAARQSPKGEHAGEQDDKRQKLFNRVGKLVKAHLQNQNEAGIGPIGSAAHKFGDFEQENDPRQCHIKSINHSKYCRPK